MLFLVALGYNSAFFGQGTGPIVMDDIRCIGNESRLIDCPFDGHTADCTHLFDVGVKCYPDEGKGGREGGGREGGRGGRGRERGGGKEGGEREGGREKAVLFVQDYLLNECNFCTNFT